MSILVERIMTQTEYSANGLSKMRRRQFIRTMLKKTKVCLTCSPVVLRTQRTSPKWLNRTV
ncbi:uncharacterized protein LACBIDRAFT_305095 [Laccaria bicolor S238N-H82]|uniref:Predicted protein n=1 Tax=Laccaria bicolor (strain S238N-H82 / ATCC MYA-4686) TaxID=486041 RepID=B0CTE5_LACBS|nr:uncharacterized protein LACBIDRAFT_305095 [Laccaria bicolor S238N-H82]EDR13904.1 predicted protein [Laccaria bicolor S238N-H82]|eukprot:XP_001874463.1 predicted protein [Laccaria bicolor S238N-H82]